MCGIIGVFNATSDILAQLPHAYLVQQNRGKDAYGIVADKIMAGKKVFTTRNSSQFLQQLTRLSSAPHSHQRSNVLIHHLHAIVASVPQPLSGKGVLSYNGEIYNWKKLAQTNRITARNDAEVLFFLLEKLSLKRSSPITATALNTLLNSLDGVFAFAYWRGNTVILCRDRLGERPLTWYFEPLTGVFAFASEGKTLEALGLTSKLLEPRTILLYDTLERQLQQWHQPFFHLPQPFTHLPRAELRHDNTLTTTSIDEQIVVKNLVARLTQACRKRVRDTDDIGILFSGGIDSTILAFLCKKLKKKFTCYTAGYCDGDMALPSDVTWSKRICHELGFPLKMQVLKTDALELLLTQVIRGIESTDVVKTGVAAPFFVCAQMAHKDGKRVMLSGLGSEELFAGYERHARVFSSKGTAFVNQECLAGLYQLWERDLYRDDLVLMHHQIELRLPYLDRDLIEYALRIPGKLKIDDEQKKIILRKAAVALGISPEVASRKKQAAQYGSSFDKGIAKMAKRKGFSTKAAYLAHLSTEQMRAQVSSEILKRVQGA